MTRLMALIADALDAAWFNHRGIVIGAFLLLGAASVAVPTAMLLSSDPGGATGVPGPGSAQPSSVVSSAAQLVDETSGPADGVAGSQRLVMDFDMLPTGSRIDGWTLTAGARLETAAQPTAVDRSARLDGEGSATACQDLDIELSGLEDIELAGLGATFMIDSVPEGEVTLLALALDDGSTHRLTPTDGNATAIATGQAVALEPGTWYRWVVVNGDEGSHLRLLAADGTLLTDAVVPRRAANARATQFCMTAAPSTRLYLSDLTVEIR